MRGVGAVIQLADVLFTSYQKQIIELAASNQLPVMYGTRLFVDAGGLMVYGPDIPDHYRRAAAYVDKILSRPSRNQTGISDALHPRPYGLFLDDLPIHIRPDLPAARVQT